MQKIETNLFQTFSWLYNELTIKGIQFNKDGYPIIASNFILKEEPEEMLPFNHRNSAKNKSKTVVCYFMNDNLLYKRISTIQMDLNSLKGFMGICGFDLSPRIGWNEDLQKFNILLSQMITVWFAVNGIKIIPNLRTGDYSTFNCLRVFEVNNIFCMGALGCWHKKVFLEDLVYLKIKLMIVRPSYLLIYGKLEKDFLEFLENQDIPFKNFYDFRRISYQHGDQRNGRC